ncbi:MAG: hypothetical protein NTV49_07090 [Kiritimatiellaeota bacterium]|nr:hypothetical protein [Kiritimatiellota bacterium]
MLGAEIMSWLALAPPALATPPTHGQLHRLCRYHARQLRGRARDPRLAAEPRQRAEAQAAWIRDVLRHHPLNDDLARTVRQSAALLRELAGGMLSAEHT